MTGGAGFLGQALTKRLCELGAKVVVLDDLSQGRTENLPKHNAVRFIQGSVLRPPCVQAAMAGADLVYHLAGVVGMRRTTASPLYAFDVSATGTKNVLDFAGKAQIVLFSSSAVYGIDHAKDATEDARLDRLSAYKYDGYCKGYASGKQEMERLGLVAANAGQDVTILRPFNIVGPGQSDEAGLVLPTFMRQSLSGEALTIFDDGSQRRSSSDIHTFTDCVLQLSHPREGRKNVLILSILEHEKPLQYSSLPRPSSRSRVLGPA